MKELPIPAVAQRSDSAREVVRVWIAEGNQHVSLATKQWPDPAAWGILLVDLVRHVANSYASTDGSDAQSIFERIVEGFEAEVAQATDDQIE